MHQANASAATATRLLYHAGLYRVPDSDWEIPWAVGAAVFDCDLPPQRGLPDVMFDIPYGLPAASSAAPLHHLLDLFEARTSTAFDSLSLATPDRMAAD